MHTVKIISLEGAVETYHGTYRSGEPYTVYDARAIAEVDGETRRIALKTDNKEWAFSLPGKTFRADRIERGKYVGYKLKELVSDAQPDSKPANSGSSREDIILAQTCLKVASEQFPELQSLEPDAIAERAAKVISLARHLYLSMRVYEQWAIDPDMF